MLLLFLSTLLFSTPPSPQLTVPVTVVAPQRELTSTTSVAAYVWQLEEERGLTHFYKTMRCESNFQNVQSNHYKDGVQEESYGIAQWHIPAGNKTQDGRIITKEMALDPKLAIDTAAWYFEMGWHKKWSCYDIVLAEDGT